MNLPKITWPARTILALLLCMAGVACEPYLHAGEAPTVIAAPALDNPKAQGAPQTAIFSGGCFWGVQGVFEHVRGVRKVLAGYSGGARNTASYEDVSSGGTGHAESVQITFDPREVTYGELLRVFFSVAHDPTELNRQGPDSGTNYRSEIFYADPEQEKIARAYIAQLGNAHVFSSPIVTRVDRLSGFYPAEAYHQDYLIHNPDSMYIVVNDLPKIGNLKRIYPQIYLDAPVMVSAHTPA